MLFKEHADSVQLGYDFAPCFDAYESAIEADECIVLAAKDCDNWIGYINVLFMPDQFSINIYCAVITMFYVKPGYKKQSVAGRLYMHAIDEIKKHKIKVGKIMASCKSDSELAKILAKRGYSEHEIVFVKEL